MGTKNLNSATDLITFTRASGGTFLGSNGLLQTAANNVPRIEYDATGAVKGLLIEEARTNLLPNSSLLNYLQFSTATSTSTVVSPSGLQDAVLVQPTVASGITWVYLTTLFNTGVVTTISTFAKASGKSFVTLSNSSGNLQYASFNLTTGAIGTVASGYTANMEDFSNGWYRCSVTTPTGFNDRSVYAVSDTDGGIAAAANGNDGILLYGAQLEAGAFPTSYIPTTGAAATRARDIAEIPTSAFGYNNDKGTVVCEFDSAKLNGSTVFTLDLDGAGTENGITTIVYPANRISYQAVTGGAVQANLNFDAYATASQVSKVATVYAKDDFAAVLNGGAVATDTAASLPTVDLLRLGVYLRGASFPMSGHIKSIQYYPRRLTNTQLQELTT